MDQSGYPYAEIGARLRSVRLARGFKKQYLFARTLGVDPPKYNQWEKGVYLIPVDAAIAVHKATGATLDFIYRADSASLPVALANEITEQLVSRSGSAA